METVLSKLTPSLLWSHFEMLTNAPRASKQEEAVLAAIRGWAEARGFEVRQDVVAGKPGNLVVKVPATKGHEAAAPVLLQGHVDMVCQTAEGVPFDPTVRPVAMRVVDGFVRATGTTLGADNGIGVAAALAVADDPSVVHGPLELLFTVDEETGLTGATELDVSGLAARRMLNLDSEELGVLYVGCAGGGQDRLVVTAERMPAHQAPGGNVALEVTVTGLKGGHSGLEIGTHRANAIMLLARTLWNLREEVAYAFVSIKGGSAHNAIPRNATATVVVGGADAERAAGVVAAYANILKDEWAAHEPDLAVVTKTAEAPESVLRTAARDRLLRMLLALPHGVQEMSVDMPGLVESSANVAVIETTGEAVEVVVSSRSSVAPALAALRTRVVATAELAGADVDAKPGYPGWRPNMASPLLATCQSVWQAQSGKAPHVTAIHAGLECGILGEKVTGMDMISFGPSIFGAHTAEERVDIASVAVFWDYLKGVLAALA